MDKIKPPKTAEELMEMYFLEIRCNLLEAAAGFDRLERAEGGEDVLNSSRGKLLLESLDLLKNSGATRAENFLKLFSEE